jgi:hypothetical protein
VLALPLRALPAALRLRELLADSLGAPRLVLASVGGADAGPDLSLLDLVECCAGLFGSEPVGARRAALGALSCVLLDFGSGREAQLCFSRGPGPARLEVVAERGRAEFRLPDRLNWTDARGRHAHWPAGTEPVARALLEQFHQTATGGQSPSPRLAEVTRWLGWLAQAATPGPPAA